MKTRRWLAVVVALLLCAAVGCQLWAGAVDQPLDLGRTCTLTVNPCDLEANKDMAEDLAQSAVTIEMDLYKVADLRVEGSAYACVPREPYGLEVPQGASNTEWAVLAQQAAQIALQPAVRTPDWKTESGVPADVEPGVYLVVAHANDAEDYVKLIEDEDGAQVLATQVDTEKYTYSFSPELVVLPNRMDENGGLGTGEWQYELSVNLKPQREGRKIPLEIVKTLLTYEDSGPATFVFQIDWEIDGEKHSDVRAITFTEPGQKALLVEDLPVGAQVTVTEVYSGVNYTLVSDPTQTLVLEADQPAQVEFINDYDNHRNGGGSIVNKFTYNGESWDWEPIPDTSVSE